MRGIEDLDLDLQKIVEYLGANGYITYSIPINRKDFENDDYYFENLNISKIGDKYEPVIVKYNADDDSKKFELSTFTGKMEIIDIEKASGGVFIYENGAKMADPAPPTNPSGEEWGGSGDGNPPSWMPTWMAELFYWNGLEPTHSGPGIFSTIISYIGNSCNCNDYTPYVLVVTPVNMGTVVNHTETGNNSGGDVVFVPTIPNWPLNLINSHVMGNLIRQRLTTLNPEDGVWLSMNATLPQNQSIYHYLLDFDYFDIEANNFAASLVNQMHLNPSYNFNPLASSLSPANIDLTSVTPDPNNSNELNHNAKVKFTCVYSKLMQSPGFKKLFIDMFQENTRPNVKFQIADLAGDQYGGLVGNTICPDNNLFNNTITIDVQLLQSGNAMDIVQAILHECIHAFLNVKLRDASIGMSVGNLNSMELANAINAYYNGFGNNQNQHSFIYDYMIDSMKDIILDVRDLLLTTQQISDMNSLTLHIDQNTFPITNIAVPWSWDDYLTNLCLGGLQQCTSFASEIATVNNSNIATNIVNPEKYSKFVQYRNVAASQMPPPNCN